MHHRDFVNRYRDKLGAAVDALVDVFVCLSASTPGDKPCSGCITPEDERAFWWHWAVGQHQGFRNIVTDLDTMLFLHYPRGIDDAPDPSLPQRSR
jgi:hypothetical protein